MKPKNLTRINPKTAFMHKPGMNSANYEASIKTINDAVKYLESSKGSPKILLKIANNMGDSLHGTPILRHYRYQYPNATIAFLTEQRFLNIHQYNTDINAIFGLPNGLDNKTRLGLWNPIKQNKSIDIALIPAINPFRALYKENDWCKDNIADQYFNNAGIKGEPAGGRQIHVLIDEKDRAYAASKILYPTKTIALEYISYSTPPKWKINQYAEFVRLAKTKGYMCLSIAGNKEPLVPGTIDLRGITWRQTVAIMERIPYVIGCGSGITMLAAAARPQPKIIELDVPENVTLKICKYAPSIPLKNPTPASIMSQIEL